MNCGLLHLTNNYLMYYMCVYHDFGLLESHVFTQHGCPSTDNEGRRGTDASPHAAPGVIELGASIASYVTSDETHRHAPVLRFVARGRHCAGHYDTSCWHYERKMI